MTEDERNEFLKKLRYTKAKKELESITDNKKSEDGSVELSSEQEDKLKKALTKDTENRRKKHQDLNNKMNDGGEFWDKVRGNSSYDTNEDGNKIPEVRSIEELTDLLMNDKSAIRDFNKQEKELIKEQVVRQEEEFKKLSPEEQKELLEKSYLHMLEDPNLTDKDKEEIKKINDYILKSLHTNEGLPTADELLDVIDKEIEPDEPIDIDSFLSEAFGAEISIVTEYDQDDYEVLIVENTIKFHIDGVVPPMTNLVFKELINTLELTIGSDNFWIFPRTAAELIYIMKEQNIDFVKGE